MKNRLLATLFLFLLLHSAIHSATIKTVNSKAGLLNTCFSRSEKDTLTALILRDTIDARDFKFLRDSLLKLESVDLHEVFIKPYTGTKGPTNILYDTIYLKNQIPSFAFYQKVRLKRVVMPDSLEKIGMNSFDGCHSLKTPISFPTTFTALGGYAFRNCDSIPSVSFNQGIKAIADFAFSNCTSLVSLNAFPTSLYYVGEDAFSNCQKLDNVVLSGTFNVSNRMFKGCTSLKSVVFSKGSYSINGEVFMGCTMLDRVAIPDGVTFIGGNAFKDCIRLETVLLPKTLSMSNAVFMNCTSLRQLTMPLNIGSIATACFKNCIRLKKLILPASVYALSDSALADCIGLDTLVLRGEKPIDWFFHGILSGIRTDACVLMVPFQCVPTFKSNPNWGIFKNIQELPGCKPSRSKLKLGQQNGANDTIQVVSNTTWTVTTDQPWLRVTPTSGSAHAVLKLTADENPSYLTRNATLTILLSDSMRTTVTVTQEQKFAEFHRTVQPGELTRALTTFEKSVVNRLFLTGKVDARDFRLIHDSLPLLEELDMTETEIVAYQGNLGTVFPYRDTSISYAANQLPAYGFWRLTNPLSKPGFHRFKMPKNTTSIGDYAFYNCTKLDTMILSDSVKSIGAFAFQNCSVLTTVFLPEGLEYIGESAFEDCRVLNGIPLPSTVKEMATRSFSSCYSIKNLKLPNQLTTLEEAAFANCYSITDTLIVPGTCRSVDQDAFINCNKVPKIVLMEGVEFVGRSAFDYCNATVEVIIPKSIKTLESFAFENCRMLKSVYCHLSDPTAVHLGWNVFSTTATLYVPFDTKESFLSTPGWNYLGHYVEMNGIRQVDSLLQLSTWSIKDTSVYIYSNVNWSARSNADWLSFPADTTPMGNGFLRIRAAENPNFTERTCRICISAKNTNSVMFTVTQAARKTNDEDSATTVEVSMVSKDGRLHISELEESSKLSVCDLSGHLLFRQQDFTGGTCSLGQAKEKMVIVRLENNKWSIVRKLIL